MLVELKQAAKIAASIICYQPPDGMDLGLRAKRRCLDAPKSLISRDCTNEAQLAAPRRPEIEHWYMVSSIYCSILLTASCVFKIPFDVEGCRESF